VFAGSAAGDAQVIRLGEPAPQSRKGKGVATGNMLENYWNVEATASDASVEVLQRWTNLAPVKDFAVVEDESGGLVSRHWAELISRIS
jgi:DNA damage-binding protein 1